MALSKISYPRHLQEETFAGGIPSDLCDVINDASVGLDFAVTTQAVSAHNRALKILGGLSALTLITGSVAAYNGWKEFQFASAIKDILGEIKGVIVTIYGALQTVGGAAYAGMTTAFIVFFSTASKTAHVASSILSNIGTGFLGASSAFGMLSWGLDVILLAECKQKISAALKAGEDPVEMIKNQLHEPSSGRRWKKALGEEMAQKIYEGNPLQLKEVEKRIHTNLAIASTLCMLSLAGTALAVLSVTSVTVIAPWMLGVIGLGLGLAWLAYDGYSLSASLQQTEISKTEKGVAYASALLCLGTSLAGLFFAENLSSIIGTAVAGTLLAIVILYTLYKMHT